jgi:hypothetical protein
MPAWIKFYSKSRDNITVLPLKLLSSLMTTSNMSAQVTTVATFPSGVFPENIAVRKDGSILVTDPLTRHLHFIPHASTKTSQITPIPLLSFEESPMGIVEVEPDVFYMTTSTPFDYESPKALWRIDFNGFKIPTSTTKPERIVEFPPEVRFLNGSAVLSPTVMLCADSFADLIWRVDLPSPDGSKPTSVRVWLKHSWFAHSSDEAKWDVPGVNGLKYDSKDSCVYFTTTAQTIFGRVHVDPMSLNPVGEPEDVTKRWMWADDLILDEEAEFAYVTTHRQNTIERIDLKNGTRANMAGEPLNLELVGPTAGSWGRGKGDFGKVAYFCIDGGIKGPVNGIIRDARVVRIEFPPVGIQARL